MNSKYNITNKYKSTQPSNWVGQEIFSTHVFLKHTISKCRFIDNLRSIKSIYLGDLGIPDANLCHKVVARSCVKRVTKHYNSFDKV